MNKSHTSLTKLEEERYRKKKRAEEMEKIDVLGQESDKKAVRPIQEEVKRIQEEEKKKEADRLERLDTATRSIKSYTHEILLSLHSMIAEVGMPRSYQWGVWFDGKGVRLCIIDKYKKKHQRAYKLYHDPVIDLRGAMILALWAEDVYDMVEGQLESPIWTPNPKKN